MFKSGSWIPSAEISLNLNNYNRYLKSGLDTTTAHDGYTACQHQWSWSLIWGL